MRKQEQGISSSKMLEIARQTKGYLYKKSRSLVGGWQKRYFLIINHTMVYYPDETLDKKKGTIQLSDITKIVMHNNAQFALETRKRIYQLKCDTQKERNLWVASLNLLKQSGDMSPIKRYLIRAKKQQKEQEQTKSLRLMMHDARQVFMTMKLDLIVNQLESPRISNRIFYCRCQNSKFYISVSIKCLNNPEFDEELLPVKYIQPYQFNKLYEVNNQKVTQICKMSLIQSFKTEEDGMNILLPDKKQLKIPIRNQYEARIVSERVCRCYQIAKEYYNPFNIILKKNVDRMVWLYQNHRSNFQEQVKYRVTSYFNRYKNQPHEPVTIFISDFHSLKKSLIETQEACRVLVPPCENVRIAHLKIACQIINKHLSEAWQYLYQLFQPFQLLSLASQIYEYWKLTNQINSDIKLLQACADLTYYFLRRKGQQIKSQIESIHFSKVQVKKVKNELISNQVTTIFYEWLIDIIENINDIAPVDKIFENFCKFFKKSFEEFVEYLNRVVDKWNQVPIVTGVCNDLSKVRMLFLGKVGSSLCQGIISDNKFKAMCSNYVCSKIDECLENCIKRIFIIMFSSIDKKILNKSFLELDIGKVCYQVLESLGPVKKKVDEAVESEIILLSFDEICFFFFTCLLKRKVMVVKNCQQIYSKTIEKGITEIQQYYCNINTEVKVKRHLEQVSVLKTILICPQVLIQKYCKELRKTFGLSFNQQCIQNILKLRQMPEQIRKKCYVECCQVLKSSQSEEDASSRVESDIHQSRPRTSTLTESSFMKQRGGIVETELVAYIKNGMQGILTCKKVEKKGMPSFPEESYFKIYDGKILELKSQGSSEIISFIDLNKMVKCYLENVKDKTFVVELKNIKYYFSARTQDQAGKWIQAIHSQTNHPSFQNTMTSRFNKSEGDGLFKDFEAEIATTATLKKKRTQQFDQEQQVFKQKRKKRYKQAKVSPLKNIKRSPSPRREQKRQGNGKKQQKQNKIKKYEQEGSCCSKGFF